VREGTALTEEQRKVLAEGDSFALDTVVCFMCWHAYIIMFAVLALM
jgi:hypothetical protein